jgi:GMP synthase-like glutamine amidotransferase
MRPLLILQQLSEDGPAFLATWLQREGVSFELRNAEAGEMPPADLSAHAGLVLLGGEMSANDPLPALRQAEVLVREAMAAGKPVLGHCLGGQLMARALGAAVQASPAPEVGWSTIDVADSAEARDWFGEPGPRTVFQWHYDAFALPPGARRLAGSAACPHQAVAMGPGAADARGAARYLALQFHPELDAEKLARWLLPADARLAAARARHPGTVQTTAAMREGAVAGLPAQQALAARLYARWLLGVPR